MGAGPKRTNHVRRGTRLLIVSATRQINDRGLTLVKAFEGLYLTAYQDEVGVWTIGYGHTGLQHNDGTVYKGRTITRSQAELLLQYDMHQFETRVSTFVKVPLTDDEYSALVSFDFNTGQLGSSTLLKKLNAKDYEGAADQLLRWVYAGGKVLRGLVRRRQSERRLFLGETPFIVLLSLKKAERVRWKNNVWTEPEKIMVK